MSEVSIKELLEAGAHFGHQVSRWNPKMRPYIFAAKGGIHVLDLEQTVGLLQKAYKFVADTVALGGSVLFVGTKKQAKVLIEEEAKRCKQFYVSNRWLGGFLTNFKTIQASIRRLEELEKQVTSPEFEKFKKKERLDITREIEKLQLVLGGIRNMQRHPSCLFIIDPKSEEIAKKEAIRLKIPIVAIVDTNCDPDGIDFVIPSNDDAIRAIQIVTHTIADACEEGFQRHQAALAREQTCEIKAQNEKKPSAFAVEKEIKEQGRAFVGGKKGEKEEVAKEEVDKYSSVKV